MSAPLDHIADLDVDHGTAPGGVQCPSIVTLDNSEGCVSLLFICLSACSCSFRKLSYKIQSKFSRSTDSEGATENAGQENDGQKCNTQNALIDH